jgi:hypothetical protein
VANFEFSRSHESDIPERLTERRTLNPRRDN